jgi:hypothetical protein
MRINENLKAFVTPRQWDCYCAYCTEGSFGKAAKLLNSKKATVAEHVKRAQAKGQAAGLPVFEYEAGALP